MTQTLAAVPVGLPVIVVSAASTADTTAVPTTIASTTETTAAPNDPSPLTIVAPELYWAGGCFIVLLILMRLFLYPRVATAMEARAGHIRGDHAAAARDRDGALVEKQQYETQLAGARAEASRVLDAARTKLEQERQVALTEVNGRVSARRQAAEAEVEAARAEASVRLADATSDVVTHAAGIVLGRSPDPAVVREAVASAMNGGAE